MILWLLPISTIKKGLLLRLHWDSLCTEHRGRELPTKYTCIISDNWNKTYGGAVVFQEGGLEPGGTPHGDETPASPVASPEGILKEIFGQ